MTWSEEMQEIVDNSAFYPLINMRTDHGYPYLKTVLWSHYIKEHDEVLEE